MKKIFTKKTFYLIPAILIPLAAFASGSEHEASHDAGIMSLKFYFINFAIYFTAIFILAKNVKATTKK